MILQFELWFLEASKEEIAMVCSPKPLTTSKNLKICAIKQIQFNPRSLYKHHVVQFEGSFACNVQCNILSTLKEIKHTPLISCVPTPDQVRHLQSWIDRLLLVYARMRQIHEQLTQKTDRKTLELIQGVNAQVSQIKLEPLSSILNKSLVKARIYQNSNTQMPPSKQSSKDNS